MQLQCIFGGTREMRVGSFFKQEIKKTCNQALSLYFKLNLGIKLVISFKPASQPFRSISTLYETNLSYSPPTMTNRHNIES